MTEQWILRPMTEEDLPQILAIEEASFPDPWSEEGFLQSLNAPASLCLVAVDAQKIAGYCIFYSVLDEAELLNVAVAQECRGRGLGEAMLREALQSLMQQGVRHFYLEVRQSNEIALSMYKKLGFRTDFVREGYYERPREDAVVMSFHKEENRGSR